MTPSMVATTGRGVTESRRASGQPADAVRLQALKADAADLIGRRWFPRARKIYRHVTPKKISAARHTGGGIADTIDLMYANPDACMEIAVHLLGIARQIVCAANECHVAALLRESKADSREDVTSSEVLADPDNPAKLREHLTTLDEAIAEAMRARDAVAKRLREVEGRR